jgi:hypothetical protein
MRDSRRENFDHSLREALEAERRKEGAAEIVTVDNFESLSNFHLGLIYDLFEKAKFNIAKSQKLPDAHLLADKLRGFCESVETPNDSTKNLIIKVSSPKGMIMFKGQKGAFFRAYFVYQEKRKRLQNK